MSIYLPIMADGPFFTIFGEILKLWDTAWSERGASEENFLCIRIGEDAGLGKLFPAQQ